VPRAYQRPCTPELLRSFDRGTVRWCLPGPRIELAAGRKLRAREPGEDLRAAPSTRSSAAAGLALRQNAQALGLCQTSSGKSGNAPSIFGEVLMLRPGRGAFAAKYVRSQLRPSRVDTSPLGGPVAWPLDPTFLGIALVFPLPDAAPARPNCAGHARHRLTRPGAPVPFVGFDRFQLEGARSIGADYMNRVPPGLEDEVRARG